MIVAGTCIFLGHEVGRGKVKPEQAKIKAVEEFHMTKTEQWVRFSAKISRRGEACRLLLKKVKFGSGLIHDYRERMLGSGSRIKTLLSLFAGDLIPSGNRPQGANKAQDND